MPCSLLIHLPVCITAPPFFHPRHYSTLTKLPKQSAFRAGAAQGMLRCQPKKQDATAVDVREPNAGAHVTTRSGTGLADDPEEPRIRPRRYEDQ